MLIAFGLAKEFRPKKLSNFLGLGGQFGKKFEFAEKINSRFEFGAPQGFFQEKFANGQRGYHGPRFAEAWDVGIGVTRKIVVLCGYRFGFGVCRGKVISPKHFEIR